MIKHRKYWLLTCYVEFIAGLQMLAVSYLGYDSSLIPEGLSPTNTYLLTQGMVVLFGLIYLTVQTFIYLLVHRITIKDRLIKWTEMNLFILWTGGPILFLMGSFSRLFGLKLITATTFQGLFPLFVSLIFIGTIYYFYGNRVKRLQFLRFSLVIVGLNTLFGLYKML